MLFFKFKNENQERLDRFVSQDLLKEYSRTQVQKMIEAGQIKVNQELVKANYRLQLNDEITVELKEEKPFKLKPVDFPIEILYEDEYLMIVNKPRDLVVHPGAGQESVTLVSALLGMNKQLVKTDDPLRPGIVHRLDKDTSGLLVVAKEEKTYSLLKEMFQYHEINREYLALVDGQVEHEFGTIDAPIGRDPQQRIKMSVHANGKHAITYFSVIKRFKDYTLLKCKLKTGRTHQIRVHLNYIGHPIVADPLYGKKNKDGLKQQLLVAYRLSFIHPITGEYLEFELKEDRELDGFIEKVDGKNV